jgi:thiol-disulfide isomerase/thioredoxin
MFKFRFLFLNFSFFVFLFCFGLAFPFFASAGLIFPDSEATVENRSFSQIGLINHSGGQQELYLKTNNRTEAEELVWIVPSPDKPEKGSAFPADMEKFQKLSERHQLEIEDEEQRNYLHFYESHSFSPEENIFDWLQDKGYNLNEKKISVLRSYQDDGWYLTAVEIVAEPLERIIKEFDQEVSVEITKDNLAQELAEYTNQPIVDNDFEEFQSRLDYLSKLTPSFSSFYKKITKEDFMEQAEKVTEENKDKNEKDLQNIIQVQIYRLENHRSLKDPQKHLEEIIKKTDEEIEGDITEDNLAQKLYEYIDQALKNDNFEEYKFVSERLIEMSVDDDGINYEYSAMLMSEDYFNSFVKEIKEGRKESFDLFGEEHFENMIKKLKSAEATPEKKYLPPIKVAFDSGSPVYPLRASRLFFIGEDDEAKMSLYVLSDDPVIEPDEWRVTSKERVDSKEDIFRSFSKETARDSEEMFLLGLKRNFGEEEISGDITFEFAEEISEEYISKPSVEAGGIDYKSGDTKADVSGKITDMGGADEVEAWFEWGKTEDLNNKTERKTYTSKEEVNAEIGVNETGTYYYRFAAENQKGAVYSEVADFSVQNQDQYKEKEKKKDVKDRSFDPQDLAPEARQLRENLKGKITLRVEANGEAHYINPEDLSMNSLGRPADAFRVMREQGVGISNKDLSKIQSAVDNLTGKDSDKDGLPDAFEEAVGTDSDSPDTDGDGYKDKEELQNAYNPRGPGKLSIDNNFAGKQKGKIFLQVEDKGQAWYVSPENNKRYFLGKPADAFQVMRNMGQGVSENNFKKLSETQETPQSKKKYFEKVPIYFFWGKECAHCEPAQNFLTQLKKEYENLVIKKFEVYNNEKNRQLFEDMATMRGGTANGVPTTFIGEKMIIGYKQEMNKEFRKTIEDCKKEGCIDLGEKINTSEKDLSQESEASKEKEGTNKEKDDKAENINWEQWQDPELFGGDRDMKMIREEPFVGTEADEVFIGDVDKANVLDARAGGDNILWARGSGKEDTMMGGPGDDDFVILGDLTPYSKTTSPQTTELLGGPLADLNGYDFNEDADGGEETIKGGAGEDTLHVIGDADISNFNIFDVEHLRIY